MTTLIDRIMNNQKMIQIVNQLQIGDDDIIREILEAELTAVNGVDELIEKRENEKETDNKDGCYKYDGFYDMFISDLKSLTQSYEQKQVRCYRCNCECGGHNIKYEYKFCPDCGGKIIFE